MSSQNPFGHRRTPWNCAFDRQKNTLNTQCSCFHSYISYLSNMRMNLTARLVEHTDVVNQYLKAQTPVVKIAEANGRRIPHKKDSVGSMPQISVFMPQVDLLRFYFSKHTIPSIPVTCLDGRSS